MGISGLKMVANAVDFRNFLKSDALKYENEHKRLSKGLGIWTYGVFPDINLEDFSLFKQIQDFLENTFDNLLL